MQVTNNPADRVTDKEMEYLRDANERQARQFAAIIAERLGRHGVSLVCNAIDMSPPFTSHRAHRHLTR